MTSDLQLGHLVGEFGWNKDRAKAVLSIWLFLLFFGLILSIFLIGIPILILAIYYVYQSFSRLISKKPVISIYQNGLVDHRKDTSRKILYEQIKNLYLSVQSVNGVLNYLVTLETHDQGKLKIDEHVGNIDRLRTLLEEQFVTHRLPVVLAAYQQGTPIDFAELRVTQSALIFGKKTLPWSEIDSIDIYKSQLVFVRVLQKPDKKEWFAKSRDYFPNMALFFALINAIQANSVSP